MPVKGGIMKINVNEHVKNAGLSVVAANRYKRIGRYNESFALSLDRKSSGAVSAAKLCPKSIGKTRPKFRKTGAVLVEFIMNGNAKDDGDGIAICLSLINLIQHEQPSLYDDVIERLKDCEDGSKFLRYRNFISAKV